MSEYVDDFTSEIPLDKMEILLQLGKEYSFDPLSCIESEKYFIKLLENYQGTKEDALKDLLRTIVAKDFEILDEKPVWVQNPDWQFNNDRPMIFVGQLEKKYDQQNLQHAYIFYVFWDRESGLTKTTIQ
ncbi:hypothetical protein [Paenibacillus sp. FSL R5-0912]|uniref:hypothetical protein n=1 Tax=Paenibacillus sp. FSL R5-0912 TaxID=1536771 RepID=UPI0004F7CD2C|nr:hypothetical protein [Paenibacillus sp. FSL R5-0912]AIQ42235.1 hypothetical protein R50912_20940 [Paenibacillus sp. FSL R5-0912]